MSILSIIEFSSSYCQGVRFRDEIICYSRRILCSLVLIYLTEQP